MKIKLAFILSFLLMVSTNNYAADIAQCSNPSGTSYYPYLGLMAKKDSGWVDDKISGGITSLVRSDDNEYDILFVDTTKQIISSKQDGGKVYILSKGKNDASFLVIYPGKTVEIYTFLIDKSGKSEYIHVTSRAGDEILIAKSTVMRGDCVFVNLDLIK